MDILSVGFWTASVVGVPAIVHLLIVLVALRGTVPSERPAILRELPGLLTFRRGSAPTSTIESSPGGNVPPGPDSVAG
jgi:hypothetical protein